jgi:hypothetical protein
MVEVVRFGIRISKCVTAPRSIPCSPLHFCKKGSPLFTFAPLKEREGETRTIV